jgi:hypothetical protein
MESFMHLYRLLALSVTSAALSSPTSADQCKAMQIPPAITFQLIDATVKLNEGALIMDRPGGRAIAQMGHAGTASATGLSNDGCWWQITLPNGTAGYVSATLVVRKD